MVTGAEFCTSPLPLKASSEQLQNGHLSQRCTIYLEDGRSQNLISVYRRCKHTRAFLNIVSGFETHHHLVVPGNSEPTGPSTSAMPGLS